MNRKTLRNIVVMMILVLGTIVVSTYPSSYAKFIEEEEDYLRYNSNIVALNMNNNVISKKEASINGDNVVFSFSFPKNPNALGLKDTYLLKNASCSTKINGVTSSEIVFLPEDEVSQDEEIRVTLTCPISSARSREVAANVLVLESVNDAVPFKYQSFSDSYTIPEVVVDVKANIIADLENTTEYVDYMEEIKAYLNSDDIGNIRGLVVEGNTYSLTDDFLGCARTYAFNLEVASDDIWSKGMIFSSSDASIIDSVGTYYLKEYYGFLNSDVSDYITSQGGFSSIILGDNLIDGVDYQDGVMYIQENVLEYAQKTLAIIAKIKASEEVPKYILDDNNLIEVSINDEDIRVNFIEIQFDECLDSECDGISGRINEEIEDAKLEEIMEFLTKELMGEDYVYSVEHSDGEITFKITLSQDDSETQEPDDGVEKDETIDTDSTGSADSDENLQDKEDASGEQDNDLGEETEDLEIEDTIDGAESMDNFDNNTSDEGSSLSDTLDYTPSFDIPVEDNITID